VNSTLALVATATGVAFLVTVSVSMLFLRPAEATAGGRIDDTRHRGADLLLSDVEKRALGWLGVMAALGIGAVGSVGDVRALVIAGSVLAAAMLAVLMPEVVFVAFLVAGGVKAAPWLEGIPVDLTLLGWLGTVLAIGLRALRRGIPSPPPGMAIAVPLAGIVMLSTLWSLDGEAGLSKALRFVLLTMTAFAAPVVLIRSRPELHRMTLAFCGFGLLVALTTVQTTNLGEPLAAAGGNEIEAALYPAVGAIGVITYMAFVNHGWRKLLALSPLLVLVPGVIAPGSRGVLVSTVVALLYFLAVLLTRTKRKFATLSVIAVIAVAAVALWPVLAGGAAARYQKQLFSTESEDVLGKRSDIYGRAIGAALDHPIGGLGVGGYTRATVVDDDLYPHNIIVEFAAEEGLIAAALFIALVAAAWSARRKLPPSATPEVLYSGSILVLLLSEAMVSFDINSNRLLWFALGLSFAVARLRVD
jgi:O-antigen ligase